jgi:hypothetical protein
MLPSIRGGGEQFPQTEGARRTAGIRIAVAMPDRDDPLALVRGRL